MRIVFFGSSQFSIPVLRSLVASKHSVVHVVTIPDRKKGRGQKIAPSVVKAFAEEHRLSVSAPERLSVSSVVENIKTLAPDLIVIASYGKIVPASIFEVAKIAPLNVHPSLLPKYRGASPIQSVILEGDERTGVSIAEVTTQLDSGDLFAKTETSIGKNENTFELSERLAEMGAKLLLETIAQLERGVATKKPQDASQATYVKKLARSSGQIDWTKPAQIIHNQVRAYYPWPSAFTWFRGKRLKILSSRCPTVPTDGSHPGTVTNVGEGEAIYVATQTTPLAVQCVQLEGRREMSAFKFALGQRIQKGEQFE